MYPPAVYSVLLRRLCMLCCLLTLTFSACATPTSALRFKRLGSLDADELSILSLMQDRQGFIWIGTHSGGLYRYNGYQAVKYKHDPRDPHSLPNDRVSALYEDRQGRIWAGTQSGLARFDPDTNNFTRFAPPDGPSNQRIVKAIVGDGADGVWLATWGGLQHFTPSTGLFVRYVHAAGDPSSLAANDVNALALDARGGLWVATWPGGLDYLAPGATGFEHRRIDSAAAPDDKLNISRALSVGHDGTLWIGTEVGVVTWHIGAPWDSRIRLDAPRSRINSLYGDSNEAVWAGTLSAGLLRWDKDKPEATRFVPRANDPHSLPSDHIRAVMQDRGGMLWVASFTDGISLANLNSQGFQRFIPFDTATDNTLPNNSVQNLAGAPGGRLWLGGNTGLSLFDPRSGDVIKSYRRDPKRPGALSSDIVYSLYGAPDGPLWIGTSSGLNRLERPDAPFKTVHFGDLASDFINAIAPSRDGKLWLGTGLEAILYDPAAGTWVSYPSKPGDPTSRSVTSTTCIVEDRRGRVWMGSEWKGGGLDLLNRQSGRFRHFRHDPRQPASLSDDNVLSLFEDAKARIWIGTAKGLNLVVDGPDGAVSFRRYEDAGSVGNVEVRSIRADAAGGLWVSTATGLLRLDPDSGKATRFRPSNGLSDGFAVGAAYAAPDGALYFSGVKGMTAVHPEAVRSVSVAPQVAISDIGVFNRSLATVRRPPGVVLGGTVTAPTGLTMTVLESVFSIEFAALHYTDPGSNRYAYRLVGFDRDWVQSDAAHRTATYTNLDPGHYRFEVKAANEQGLWSSSPTTLKITIVPPFWQQWWFRMLAALLAFGLLAAAYRARVRLLTRSQARLQALVAERTSELEDSNAKLAALSNTDGLTGVTNRRGFDGALEREWRRADRHGFSIALAMLDVDHFKSYNDLYGHQAGDQCLRAVATLIAAHGRRTSDTAARYGGEEFTLLAPATDTAHALAIARGVCAALQEMALVHAGSPFGVVTLSIGVSALTPNNSNSADLLVQYADRALYRAKQAGRNRALAYESETEATPTPQPAPQPA